MGLHNLSQVTKHPLYLYSYKEFTHIFLCGLLALLSGCNSQEHHYLTLNEVIDAGFYVYLLDENYDIENQWDLTVRMWSTNKHCNPISDEDAWNPVQISYENENSDFIQIRISPQDALWDPNQNTENLDIDVDWMQSGEAKFYYNDAGQVVIRLSDTLGQNVIITTNISLDNTLDAISHLSYQGGAITHSSNPWYESCQL